MYHMHGISITPRARDIDAHIDSSSTPYALLKFNRSYALVR